MTYLVTENQDKKVTRTYKITGPKLSSVVSFWDFLVAQGIIESYSVSEGRG